MTAFSLSAHGAAGWVLLAAAPVAAVGAAWWAWRRTAIRDARARAGIAALRGVFVFLAVMLLADPEITRTGNRLPQLSVRWTAGGSLEVPDAPGGATRRAALAATIERARSIGLDRRFEIVDGERRTQAGAGGDSFATILMCAQAPAPEALPPGRVVAVTPPRDPAVPDLSVLSVQLPARAASGSPVEAIATIRARGAAGRKVVVTLSDGARVARSVSRDITEPDETFTLALGAILQSAGWQKVTVEAAGLTGEVSLADNRLERWIELEPGQRRVLFVESAPSWEGKFVRRALEKDETIRVDYATSVSREAVVDVRAADGETASSGKAKPSATGAGPASLRAVLGDERRLFGYDAIVLGPLDAAALPEADAARVVRFVDSRGGGLVVLGGNAFAGSAITARGPLAKLLPVEIPASRLGRADGQGDDTGGSVVLVPAEGFSAHPAFAMLGDEPATALRQLQKLGNAYVKVGALAAGAEAIAVDGASANRAPLVVAQRYGAGRVTFVAAPDTWRLSVGATAELEDVSAKFWTGLVGWTAAGARERFRLWAERTAVSTGSPARLILEARAADWSALAAARIEGRAVHESPLETRTDPGTESGVDVRFVPDVADPGRFVASAVLPLPGTWLVTAEIDGRETATARVEAVTDEGTAGRPDPSTEAAAATALAASGGGLVRDGSAETLLETLGTPATAEAIDAIRPADGIWWAFVLPLLFAGEAFLRRRSGADSSEVPGNHLD